MFNIGFGEFVLIVLIVFIVFGPGKMPQLARSLGATIREFRKACDTMTEEVMTETKDVRQVAQDIQQETMTLKQDVQQSVVPKEVNEINETIKDAKESVHHGS